VEEVIYSEDQEEEAAAEVALLVYLEDQVVAVAAI